MKKIVMSIAIVALISSCKKEEKTPCNCGIVQSDNVSNYSVVIRNDCSFNDKSFVLTPSDWMNAHVGSRYCITNETQW
jgi:hypothetical protein